MTKYVRFCLFQDILCQTDFVVYAGEVLGGVAVSECRAESVLVLCRGSRATDSLGGRAAARRQLCCERQGQSKKTPRPFRVVDCCLSFRLAPLCSPTVCLLSSVLCAARKQEIIKITEQLIEAINNGDFEAYT